MFKPPSGLASTEELIGKILWENSPQEKKARILQALLRVTITEGLAAVSVTRLAKETGLAKALINYHVPDFHAAALELLKLASLTGTKTTESYLSQAQDPTDELRLYVRAAFEWAREYSDLARFSLLMYHRSSVDPEVRALHTLFFETAQGRVADILKRLKIPATPLSLRAQARLIHSAIVSEILRMLALHEQARAPQLEAELHAFILRSLHIKKRG